MRKLLLLCLAMCLVFAMTALAFDDMGKSTTVNGWVSDSKCGANGANAKSAACTKKCLAAGAEMGVVTDADQKVLMVKNPEALKGHEGHHVAVTGQGEGDSIHDDSAKVLEVRDINSKGGLTIWPPFLFVIARVCGRARGSRQRLYAKITWSR